MSILQIVKASSRKGNKLIERLQARGDEVVDALTKRRAEQIVDAVRRGGDRALLKAVSKYDGISAKSVEELRLDPGSVLPSDPDLPAGFPEGLERSIAAVERYHRPQVDAGYRLDEAGMQLEERVTPLRRVGVYVPGGRFAYPSTAVMTVIPARVAGVSEVVVVTPATAFHGSAALRYTLKRLGVTEIWGLGGAHAIAALAFGTQTISRVDKIVGPGNSWVSAAKQVVSGRVGIEGIAGPTEVVIVATDGVDPTIVAADLLAQAEHDVVAASILVTPSKAFAREVDQALQVQLGALPPSTPARASLKRFGAAILVADIEEAATVVERLAPEHLQLVGEEAESLADRPLPAGAIFVGIATPEVFGDYVAGPSHVLPTCGSARFASALGVYDFVRRSHVVRCEPGAATRWAAAAVPIAEAEGLPAHARSALRRLR